MNTFKQLNILTVVRTRYLAATSLMTHQSRLTYLSHHHHHHSRISSRRKSWTKLQGRCVSRITLMSMWPILCVAIWSAEQFRLQCTLECLQWWQQRDRRWQRIPNFCSGNGKCTIADGLVQRPWNMQRLWRCIADAYVSRCRRPAVTHCRGNVVLRSYGRNIENRFVASGWASICQIFTERSNIFLN